MIDFIDLAGRLKGRHVQSDCLNPWPYNSKNPEGRLSHDDWKIPWIPSFLQPWTRIPRRLTTYYLPVPSKKVAGNVDPQWVLYQPGYPLAPDAQVEDRLWWDGKQSVMLPHVLTMLPVHDIDWNNPKTMWSRQAVWLDGEWRECYYTISKPVNGKRLHHNHILKPDWDFHPYKPMGSYNWSFPDISLSYVKA